jgi:D-alanine-D-alanine ligase
MIPDRSLVADRIRVALFFGGRSSEHAISCATAGGVLGAMDPERYEVVLVGITRDGAMTLRDRAEVASYALGDLPEVHDNGTRVRLPESASTRELLVQDAQGVRSLGDVDVVFPILHGPLGEDGTIQGALELVGVPYVGNGVLASALAMEKHVAKTVLEGAGIVVAPWVTVTRNDLARHPDLWRRRIEGLGLPAFVKPARAGSSVGVSRVSAWAELEAALDVAFAEDSRVLVEAAIMGRELECAVLEGRDGAPPRVSVAGEIAITGRDFYDFDAKYLDAPGVQLICPAELGEQELARMQDIAARAFEAIGGAGLARVDFFFTGTDLVVNEINTMPGFTPISMFPACWLASGVGYPELIDELIALGMAAVR